MAKPMRSPFQVVVFVPQAPPDANPAISRCPTLGTNCPIRSPEAIQKIWRLGSVLMNVCRFVLLHEEMEFFV